MGNSKFGKAPFGDRLERIKKSPNYRDGKFQNLSLTPSFTEGHTFGKVLFSFLFKRIERRKPEGLIPTVKTDLLNLPADQDVLIWFGHSSYFLQIDGKKFLVDPVFSKSASPVRGSNKPFKGTLIYGVDDLPQIDYLLLTHDHYDHMDFETIKKMNGKIGEVICPLGVGSHLEYWGYDSALIHEKDWHDSIDLLDGFSVSLTPARHFSGRLFSRNNTLWCSYVLQTPALKIFIGGDSGYDAHFKNIGEQFGPFDLAILENGQYNPAWKYIHALPEEVLQAATDLKAKRILPVHSSKFALSNHAWDEPLAKISELNKDLNHALVTPMIGEVVFLKDSAQTFDRWWERVN